MVLQGETIFRHMYNNNITFFFFSREGRGKKKKNIGRACFWVIKAVPLPLQFQANENKMGAEEPLFSPSPAPGCINSRRP